MKRETNELKIGESVTVGYFTVRVVGLNKKRRQQLLAEMKDMLTGVGYRPRPAKHEAQSSYIEVDYKFNERNRRV
jgi:hypothetical protein